ncbi:DEAD/DEAH box helicase [Alkalihalobacterium elongatum]|uniref:DEAD/DEAH box helicase n=1 Tax=Alkalihalobacterium elongatum TaxID=2675466 RepID=UPI001C1FD941|nr:DEAD/DEAH box helicase [Alkalihalobacterium elongatum]
MSKTFLELGLNERYVKVLAEKGIETPTKIQEQGIPNILAGKNVVLHSQTGSGKTLAFVLPLLEKLDETKQDTQALIIAPTQELAMQIFQEVKELTKDTTYNVEAFIGSGNIKRQLEKLKKAKPQLVVGTPKRVLELAESKLKLHNVESVVFDEADRQILDKKSNEDYVQLERRMPGNCQFIFASATATPELLNRLSQKVSDPVFLSVNEGIVKNKIEHLFIVGDRRQQVDQLKGIIRNLNVTRGMVFVNNLERVKETVEKLSYHGIKAGPLSSEQDKFERADVMNKFSKGELHILVATDVAARGIDIQNVTHVMNLQLTEEKEGYLHRAGRTGRMGKEGTVISLITRHEINKLKKWAQAFDITLHEKQYQYGKLTDYNKSDRPQGKKPINKQKPINYKPQQPKAKK